MMETRERALIFATFLLSCGGLALLTGSLASKHWVVAAVHRPVNPKSEGRVHFGLFWGTRRLNHGFGERVNDMNVVDVQYREKTFFVRELYATTIACVCAALLFGLISACLALYNTASNPVESVCHFPGLIAFNCIAFLLALAAVITWLVQYFTRLRANLLMREDVAAGWNSEGKAVVGFSFWLVFIAALVYFANSVIFLLLQRNRSRIRTAKNHIIEATSKPNGNLMLY